MLYRRPQKETCVILTGVGVYSYNTKNGEVAVIRNNVEKTLSVHDYVLQMHGFYLDIKKMRFDAVISFSVSSNDAMETMKKELKAAYPDYEINITTDVDISEV